MQVSFFHGTHFAPQNKRVFLGNCLTFGWFSLHIMDVEILVKWFWNFLTSNSFNLCVSPDFWVVPTTTMCGYELANTWRQLCQAHIATWSGNTALSRSKVWWTWAGHRKMWTVLPYSKNGNHFLCKYAVIQSDFVPQMFLWRLPT